MKNMSKKTPPPSAEKIARMAERGGDVSGYFTNRGEMMPAVRRVNVDFAEPMLRELDEVVAEMNVSRQAVIKAFLRQALDQHFMAVKKHRLLAIPRRARDLEPEPRDRRTASGAAVREPAAPYAASPKKRCRHTKGSG